MDATNVQIVQTVQLQLLLAIRAFFVEFVDACDLGAVSDSAMRLGLDFRNAAEGQVSIFICAQGSETGQRSMCSF